MWCLSKRSKGNKPPRAGLHRECDRSQKGGIAQCRIYVVTTVTCARTTEG